MDSLCARPLSTTRTVVVFCYFPTVPSSSTSCRASAAAPDPPFATDRRRRALASPSPPWPLLASSRSFSRLRRHGLHSLRKPLRSCPVRESTFVYLCGSFSHPPPPSPPPTPPFTPPSPFASLPLARARANPRNVAHDRHPSHAHSFRAVSPSPPSFARAADVDSAPTPTSRIIAARPIASRRRASSRVRVTTARANLNEASR